MNLLVTEWPNERPRDPKAKAAFEGRTLREAFVGAAERVAAKFECPRATGHNVEAKAIRTKICRTKARQARALPPR